LSEGDVNMTAGREAWTAGLSGMTRAALEEDERYFLRQSLSTPCLDVLSGARGATLVDLEGREILDFHGNSAHQVGWGHPKVVAAVKTELDSLPFCPRRFTNAKVIELARRLTELAPGQLGKVLFAPSGAAAMGMALKLARTATRRHKTISMWESFHGANLDTISIGGEALFRNDLGPLLPGTEHVPPLRLAKRFFGDDGHAHERLADYIDYVLEVEGDIAALVAEPVRWTTVDVPPPGFWPKVRESCDKHGTLLIFDEVPSCLGRTGSMFVCEHFDVVPDILVVGKGLGGGIMPLAATICRLELDVAAGGALGHYTHEKSPLGAAAALATLEVIEEEGLVQRAREVGSSTLGHLQDLSDRNPLLGSVRGLGMYWGVEVKPFAGLPATELADCLLYACLEQGLSFKVGGGDVVTLCPPLNIADHELDKALGVLGDAAAAVSANFEREQGR